MNEVIIDAGPIIHLSQLKLFHLLEMFPHLHTTTEVWKEITRFDLPGKKEVEGSEKVKVHQITPREKERAALKAKGFRLQTPDLSLLALSHKLSVGACITRTLVVACSQEINTASLRL